MPETSWPRNPNWLRGLLGGEPFKVLLRTVISGGAGEALQPLGARRHCFPLCRPRRVVQFNVMLLDFVSTAVLVMLRLEAFLACLAFAHSALFHQAPSE